MRANGTRTPAEKRAALAKVEQQITVVDAALAILNTNADLLGTSEPVGDAWNALHDALTHLRAEHREVEMNRPSVRRSSASFRLR